jgi:hypothetical protein
MKITISPAALREFEQLTHSSGQTARLDLSELLAHAESTKTATSAGSDGRQRFRVRWGGYRYELIIRHGELVQVRGEKAHRDEAATARRAERHSAQNPPPSPRPSGPSGPSPNQEERRARGLPVNITIALYPHEIEALDDARGEESRARYIARLILG